MIMIPGTLAANSWTPPAQTCTIAIVLEQAGRAATVGVEVLPITDADLPAVASFLGTHFPPDTSADRWAQAWRRSVNLPGSEAPNHGFLLRSEGRVVGAYPAIYSTRLIDGRRERFCNLAVWYVDPAHRFHSIRMLKALLAQEDWHFTDLTPIEVVQKLNLRLGFRYLDTTTALVPNLPLPTRPGRVRITADPERIEAALTGPARSYYRDHADCRWAQHLALIHGDRSCYVQWRRDRLKRLPLFASIRYASDPALLRQAFRQLGRYLLVRHGAVGTLAELRVVGGRPRPSLLLPNPKRRMVKSTTLPDAEFDYLYSEITSAP